LLPLVTDTDNNKGKGLATISANKHITFISSLRSYSNELKPNISTSAKRKAIVLLIVPELSIGATDHRISNSRNNTILIEIKKPTEPYSKVCHNTSFTLRALWQGFAARILRSSHVV